MTTRSELHGATTVGHVISAALTRHPDRTAIVDSTGALSYARLAAEIATAAQALLSAGVRRGDAVAQLAGNSARAWAVQAAAYVVGARFVGVHERAATPDQAFTVADSEAVVLVVADDVPATTVGELTRSAQLRALLTEVDVFDAVRTDVSLGGLLDAFPDDVARLAYTGGTTGVPKGVLLSHRALVANTMMTMAQYPWPRDIRFVTGAPITHGAGSYIVPVLAAGGTVVLLPRFTPDGFVEAVQSHHCTAAHVVPTMIYDLLDRLDGDARPLATLEMIRYGASPISLSRLEEAISVLGGHRLVQGYGQTEAPNTISVLAPDEHVIGSPQLGSVGVPFVGNEVAVLDEVCQPVPSGGAGEICVRSPLVMDGYWHRDAETQEAFAGDWLHTGDLGRVDERGFLHIVGRKKDLIITGGFNVYPKEIENVLARHPAVAQAAVVGISDPRWGEAVTAAVVTRPGHAVTESELIELVKTSKGSVAAPKRVVFLDELPRTPVGKPDKRTLARELTDGSTS